MPAIAIQSNPWPARLGIAAIVSTGLLLLFLVNPLDAAWLPPCLFHKWTGLHCPGCGATRATHYLLHGEWALALRHNALLVLGLPVAGLLWFWWRRAGLRARAVAGWAVLTFIVSFAILRNVPLYPFTLFRP